MQEEETDLRTRPKDFALRIIRMIDTSLSIESEDLDLSPFNKCGGLGKAPQLFVEQLPNLIDELDEVLAAWNRKGSVLI